MRFSLILVLMARLDGKDFIPNGLRLNMSWQRTYKDESHGRIPVALVSKLA
jgi:hypothetical protein